ncbi:hypothetical protein PENANT_c013G07449 [Penicillium antarcticum]|uniref:Maintenance of telomere capping protein 1 n=1 Tax=Penicillium antarcticum TaxID=416450 RepID=A0A1V6Q4W0_9EURO|nr:uncharacterized protein N7508_004281 [Penicillium antarcticum]KAJ5308902.1 hypothetical protein N7508_004281 [Penicillium antarcticum]OQD84293.1 hypothetical protein PENANT_c013G07449 [Penicillium antarcticum]
MPPKAPKPTSDELLAQFDDLGLDKSGNKTAKPNAPHAEGEQEDILAELDHLATQRPSSGPGTPRLSSDKPRSSTRSPRPSTTIDRSNEDKAPVRQSEETGRTSRTETKPQQPKLEAESAPAQRSSSSEEGGGWWGGWSGGLSGGLFATATAAMKQAEAAVKEIQNNEEAQKWAQQVKGNVGALRDLGGELRDRALPTFTNLIHTLAPPISSHERLQIHVTHDLSGYPGIDPLVYSVFSRVMSQVEGGDLLVIQRGQESSPKRGLDVTGYMTSAGWNDGPWWRTVTPGQPRTVSAVRGVVDGSKLARVSAESYANEYFSSRGGVEEAAKQATEVLSESNPVRSSDIFLAIQAISQTTSKELFQAGASEKADDAEEQEEEICFALYLHDPIHGIAFHTISQAIPRTWIDWLDESAPAPENPDVEDAHMARVVVPAAIAEIIESGGVDPREWVSEWIEETLSLAAGTIAQRYVARRMGVGAGGAGKGKMRAEQSSTVESGAGEAARAI